MALDLVAAKSDPVSPMARTGRPTQDPKASRITIRLAERDLAALAKVAEGAPLADTARRLLREVLSVPELPLKRSRVQKERKP